MSKDKWHQSRSFLPISPGRVVTPRQLPQAVLSAGLAIHCGYPLFPRSPSPLVLFNPDALLHNLMFSLVLAFPTLANAPSFALQ